MRGWFNEERLTLPFRRVDWTGLDHVIYQEESRSAIFKSVIKLHLSRIRKCSTTVEIVINTLQYANIPEMFIYLV